MALMFAPELPLVASETHHGSGEKLKGAESNISYDSYNSFSSEKWSRKGISSRAGSSYNIDLEDGRPGPHRHCHKSKHDEGDKCCLTKVIGNYILPGICGIYNHRVIKKLHYKHPISQTLLNNTICYCYKIREFIRNELLFEMKELATELYFPTGQIEADGLSAISAEIWAATYLLLGLHKHIREADYQSIRTAYSSLAWDSGRAYRCTLQFFRCLKSFQTKILPLWNEVEAIGQIVTNNDFADIDSPSSWHVKDNFLYRPIIGPGSNSSPLPKLRVHDQVILENALTLQLVPERQSQAQRDSLLRKEANFSEIGYGKQMEVIKTLIAKPVAVLNKGALIFGMTGAKLTSEKLIVTHGSDGKKRRQKKSKKKTQVSDLSCSSAIKILLATLKLLFEEVKLTSELRMDVNEWVRSVTEDINAFFAYAEWVCSKFSEFHSMLKLCYNFAMTCYDLDLPKFEHIVERESSKPKSATQEAQLAQELLLNPPNAAGQGEKVVDLQAEYKVMSLTELMEEASTSFIAPGKSIKVDEDFNWQDFYKTDYSSVVQKLPLRLGNNLLQFSPAESTNRGVNRRYDVATSNAESQWRTTGSSPGNYNNAGTGSNSGSHDRLGGGSNAGSHHDQWRTQMSPGQAFSPSPGHNNQRFQ